MFLPIVLAFFAATATGQRITTIQLDGVQYFISRMNPYSPELNYFLAYQYCRSIGLQLASFETKEKSDSIMEYLKNAGYHKYDFWTSGNRLGTDMMIWMSTGLPFNATFDYMRKAPGEDMPVARQLGAVEQRKDSGAADGCVTLRAPDLIWDTDDCTNIKDFICEQTRCYYYNYGSIPVSSSQGNKIKPQTTSTTTAHTTPSGSTVTIPVPTTTPIAIVTSTSTESITKASIPECITNNSTDGTTTTQMIDCVTENEIKDTTPEAQTTNPPTMLRTVARNKPAELTDSNSEDNSSPWSWARNIMLEKPVLKKSSTL